jgi:hypothetical protein
MIAHEDNYKMEIFIDQTALLHIELSLRRSVHRSVILIINISRKGAAAQSKNATIVAP